MEHKVLRYEIDVGNRMSEVIRNVEELLRYHPHGNSPVYDALVKMVQDFHLLLTFILFFF